MNLETIEETVKKINIENKLITCDSIYSMFEQMLLENEDIDCFLSNLSFKSIDGNTVAFYANDKKRIYIDYKKLVYISVKESFKVDNYKLIFINLNILKVLFHEFEHANQEKKMKFDENDFERKILLITNKSETIINDWLMKKDVNYLELKNALLFNRFLHENAQFYETSPVERQAEIEALYKIICISKFFNNNYIVKVFEKSMLNISLKNYKLDNNRRQYPIQLFFEYYNRYFDCENFYKLFEEMNIENYQLPFRISYGLKISYDEFRSLKLKQKII